MGVEEAGGGTRFYPLPDSPSGGSGGDWGERSLTTSLPPPPVGVEEAGGGAQFYPLPDSPSGGRGGDWGGGAQSYDLPGSHSGGSGRGRRGERSLTPSLPPPPLGV